MKARLHYEARLHDESQAAFEAWLHHESRLA